MLASSDFPNPYPKSSDCLYRIQLEEGFLLVLEFDKTFDVEDHPDVTCPYDYVKVRVTCPYDYVKVRVTCPYDYVKVRVTFPYDYVKVRVTFPYDYVKVRVTCTYDYITMSVTWMSPVLATMPCALLLTKTIHSTNEAEA